MKKFFLVVLIVLVAGSVTFAGGDFTMKGTWDVYVDIKLDGKLAPGGPGWIAFGDSKQFTSTNSSLPGAKFSGEILTQNGKTVVYYKQTAGTMAVFSGHVVNNNLIVGTWCNVKGQIGDAKLERR